MDAQICLKKLQWVGVLNFATVGLDGTPQVRCIWARHGKSGLFLLSKTCRLHISIWASIRFFENSIL